MNWVTLSYYHDGNNNAVNQEKFVVKELLWSPAPSHVQLLHADCWARVAPVVKESTPVWYVMHGEQKQLSLFGELEDRQACCRAIGKAVQASRITLSSETVVDEDCQKQLAWIPPFGSVHPSGAEHSHQQLVPVASWQDVIVRYWPTDEPKSGGQLWSTPSLSSSCLGQHDDVASRQCHQHHFVWNENMRSGYWIHDDKKSQDDINPTIEEHTDFKNKYNSPLRFRDGFGDQQPTQNNQHAVFKGYIESTLSKAGGMHRDMQHRITIPISYPASPTTKQSFTMSVDVLLFVPPDLFLDVENVISAATLRVLEDGNCERKKESAAVKVTVETYNNSIINIEEPAFESPSHVVLVRLEAMDIPMDHRNACSRAEASQRDVSVSSSKVTQVEISFASHWHVRYPMPVDASHRPCNHPAECPAAQDQWHGITDPWRLVMIRQPVLVDGKAWIQEDGQNARTAFLQFLRQDGVGVFAAMPINDPSLVPAFPLSSLGAPPVMTLWVATGHVGDFELVVGVTILVALWGTCIMLRDILRISK